MCLVGLGILSSCSKDKKQDYFLTAHEKTVKRSCGEMNKLTNLLEYDSFRWAIICWGWDLDYPDFYSAIQKVDPDSWNHLMISFDEFFFNNKERRYRYLKLFNDLDKFNILKDFEILLGTITEKNFNDLIHRVLGQALSIKENGAEKKSILLKLMDILRADQESIIRFEKLYKATSVALKGDNKYITPVFSAFLQKDNFKEKRIVVVDQFFKSLSKSGLGLFDKYFIDSFMSYKNEEGRYWFYQWIKKLKKDPGPLLKLLSYGHTLHPTATLDINNFLALTPTLSCRTDGNRGDYSIDTEKKLRIFMERLANDDLIEFIDFSNEEVVELHLAESICNIENELKQRGTDLSLLIKDVFKFIHDPQIYLFFQRVHQNILATEETLNERNPYYLSHFYLGDFYQEASGFNKYFIDDEGSQYIQVLINIMSSYSEEDYENFIYFLRKAMKAKNLDILNGMGSFWLSLDSSEKDSFLNLVDVFFEKDLNYWGLLKLGEVFMEDLKVFLPLLANNIARDDAVKNKTLWSLYHVSKELKGQKVSGDFKKIFSHREILRTFKIIAGTVFGRHKKKTDIDGPTTLKRDQFLMVSDLLKINRPECYYQKTCKKELECFESLSEVALGLTNLSLELPKKCQEMESHYFPFRFIQYLNKINIESTVLGHGPLVTENGLGKKEVLNELIGKFLLLKEKDSPMKPMELINFVKEMLLIRKDPVSLERPGLMALGDSIQSLQFLLKDSNVGLEKYLTYLKDELAYLSDLKITRYAKIFSKILENYSQSHYEEREKFNEEHSCRSMFPRTYRVDSCPDKKVIKDGVKNILSILKRKNEGKEPALGLLVKALTPGHGARIPFLTEEGEKKHIHHVIDLQQYVLYAYDSLTHKDTVRFYTGPKEYDYFDSKITQAEQTEITMRDVGFFGSYFGFYYFNTLALGWDYVESVQGSIKQFEKFIVKCLNNPICSFLSPVADFLTFGTTKYSLLPKKAKFWSLNVMNTSPSLIRAADNYEHNGKVFHHDNFIKAFTSVFVQSSPEEAQYHGLLSEMSDHYTTIHNAGAMFQFAEISGLKNMARFVYDRFGPKKSRFNQIIFGEEFQRVNRKLFQGISVLKTQEALLNILNKYLGPGKELDGALDTLIDWIYDLPYEKQRVVEEVVGDIVIIISSLGKDLKDSDFKDFGDTYAGNNIFNFIDSLENWVLITHQIIQHFPKDVQLFDIIDVLRDPIRFIRNGLSTRTLNGQSRKDSVSERRKLFYVFINESFKIADTLMSKKSGIDFSGLLLGKIQKRPKAAFDTFKSVVVSWRKVLRSMHFEQSGKNGPFTRDRKSIEHLAKLIGLYARKKQASTHNIRSWLASTSHPLIDGKQNTEYKKLRSLIDYLLLSPHGQNQYGRLHSAVHQVLVTDYDSLEAYVDKMLVLLNLVHQK